MVVGALIVVGLSVGLLLFFLLNPTIAKGTVVWCLAGLLPLLGSLALALNTQNKINQVLKNYEPMPVDVFVSSGTQVQDMQLTPQEALCTQKALMLNIPATLKTSAGFIKFDKTTLVEGTLPSPEIVEALGLQGAIACPNLITLKKPV